MGLEQLLNTIRTDANSRITRTSKQRLADSIAELDNYSLSIDEIHELNTSAAALMRRHHNGLQGYQAMASTIYSHSDQHSSNALHTPIYDAFKESRRHYVNRFADIHEHLDNAEVSYHDALQIRDDLLSNRYLRNKARKDPSFDTHRQVLLDRIDRELYEHNQPPAKPSLLESIAVPAAASYGVLTAAYQIVSAVLW